MGRHTPKKRPLWPPWSERLAEINAWANKQAQAFGPDARSLRGLSTMRILKFRDEHRSGNLLCGCELCQLYTTARKLQHLGGLLEDELNTRLKALEETNASET